MNKNKYVIYTCLTGNYDTLKQPLVVDDEFDYICFSNDIVSSKEGVWKIVQIPFHSEDKLVESRFVKMQPHAVLQDYEYSVWIDANIQIIKDDFYFRIKELINKSCLIGQVNHSLPFRDCIYEEISACIGKGRISLLDGLRQFRNLKKQKYPRHFGLYENNLLLRKHNDDFVIKISNLWWSAFLDGAKRDQFSLMPIYWREDFLPDMIFPEDKCARNVDCLSCIGHKQKWIPTLSNKLAYRRDIMNKKLFDILSRFL